MPDGLDTVERETQVGGDRGRVSVRGRLSGLSGAVTAGLIVLAVLVLAAQVWAWVSGYAGPGLAVVGGHIAAAAGAVAAQRVADREKGRRAGACKMFVGFLALAVLALFWWL